MRWATPRRRTGSRSCSRTTAAPPARWPRSSAPGSTRTTWPSGSGGTRRSAAPAIRSSAPSCVPCSRRMSRACGGSWLSTPSRCRPGRQEIQPWDAVALGRYIIWGWPLGEAVHELGAAGIRLTPPAYRGSNEMLIAPGRTAMKAPIAVVDPHLSWYGSFRFYEARLYARDDGFAVSGVSILGQPIPSLGHSRYCSVAMTTGGPDTSDVYEEEVKPDDLRVVPLRRPVAADDRAHLSDRGQGRCRGEARGRSTSSTRTTVPSSPARGARRTRSRSPTWRRSASATRSTR